MVSRYRTLLGYALRQWPWLLALVVLYGVTAAVAALQPWPLKLLVDYAIGGGATLVKPPLLWPGIALPATAKGLVILAAVGTFALFALNTLLSAGIAWSWTVAGRRIVYAVSADIFSRLQRLSLLFHSRRNVGDALTRVLEDSWGAHSFIEAILVGPIRQLLTLATIGTVAWKLDSGLAVLSLAILPPLVVSAHVFGRWIKLSSLKSVEAQSSLLSFAQQTLSALPIVQAFGGEDRNRRRFDQLAATGLSLSRRKNVLNRAFTGTSELVNAIGTAVILYAAGHEVLLGVLSLGSLLVFLAYIRTAQAAFAGLLENYVEWKSVEVNLDRVFEVLDSGERVEEVPDAPLLSLSEEGSGAHVRFEDVGFGYEPGRPVLRGVSIEARRGELVALVGATGAGKSTLMSLVPRFFDPWSGRVTIDGTDVRQVQLKSLRNQIALVLQEPFLLPLSVADNIAYGRPEATRGEIEAAAVAANANVFIERLPQGYDTVIGERGATLSGGERQRLAIARAFLKDAPILLLDEPTSALDGATEGMVLTALERLVEGRTVLVIAHRLSTVRRANRIVVLHDGMIAETGTHNELIANGGIYHRLYSAQLGQLSSGAAA